MPGSLLRTVACGLLVAASGVMGLPRTLASFAHPVTSLLSGGFVRNLVCMGATTTMALLAVS